MNFGMIRSNQSTKTKKSIGIHIKTEDFYEDIANDVKKWF